MERIKVDFFAETLGLRPIGTRLKQAGIALFGEEDVPPTKWGLSSLSQLKPKIGLPLWRGQKVVDKKVILSNLFNLTPTDPAEGWSVRKTQVKDFRGRELTYNSHNGTDLAIPINTVHLAAASGEIVIVKNEFNRGGLKIMIDHGRGLATVSVHLARALVKVGDIVKRGQPIAITGYSGLDGFVTCPWGIPHVHYNTWHNSMPTDPFETQEQAALWRHGNSPKPTQPNDEIEDFKPSVINEDNMAKVIDSCKTQKVKDYLNSIDHPRFRAFETMMNMNYYPTRFSVKLNLYDQDYPREGRLDLPFYANEFDGVMFMDDLNL